MSKSKHSIMTWIFEMDSGSHVAIDTHIYWKEVKSKACLDIKVDADELITYLKGNIHIKKLVRII